MLKMWGDKIAYYILSSKIKYFLKKSMFFENRLIHKLCYLEEFFFERILLKCIKLPNSNAFSVELIDLSFLKKLYV
jgi:hypothetical protein